MKESIRQAGKELGLDVVGFAPARRLPELEQHLADLSAAGYLSRFLPGPLSAHTDPERVLPGARSIIVGALSYLCPVSPRAPRNAKATHPPDIAHPAGRPSRLRGRLARYTWGPDYHPLLRRQLQELARRLPELSGEPVESVVLVDGGSLLDRAAAAAAGVGWIGKNGCLINPVYGSWIVLGQIVTTLMITPDEPLANRCGRCDQCLRACPTGALVAPGVLDASRCVSEWTQRPGMVPVELRRGFGNFIFGCDICQEVCPWNAKARPGKGSSPLGAPVDEDSAFPPLAQFLEPSRRVEERIRGRAHGWRGARVLQRNAIIALGNSGDPSAIPLLRRFARHPSPVLSSHARWALAQLGASEHDPADLSTRE